MFYFGFSIEVESVCLSLREREKKSFHLSFFFSLRSFHARASLESAPFPPISARSSASGRSFARRDAKRGPDEEGRRENDEQQSRCIVVDDDDFAVDDDHDACNNHLSPFGASP